MSRNNNLNVTNAWICRISGQNIFPVFGDILISDGRISEIRKKDFADFISRPEDNSGESVNAGGRAVTVPMVNYHDHFYSRLAKGLPVKEPMDNFKLILENLWWKLDVALDPEMICASAQMAAMESIRNGVTYIFDHHSSPNFAEGSLGIIGNVLREFKLRGVLCFETTDRNGQLLSDNGLSENINFFRNSSGDDLKALLGLHASFTVNDDTIRRASEIIKELGLGIHIHLCEDKADRADSLEKFGKSPVERLQGSGLLNNKSILAHGIHLSDKEYHLIENSGSAIAYNPDSNLNNAVGLPSLSLTYPQIPLLTGTDGMNSNPARAMKQLFLLARHQGSTFDESFSLIKKVYFDQLSFIKKYYADYPSLNVNDRADLIIWDYIPPTPFLEDNFWGHFIYGILDRPVHSVIQNGAFLMKEFRLLFDEQEYQKNIVKQGSRLYNKMSNPRNT